MSGDIFEALRADHDIQRDLVDRLVETQGDSPERAELFSRLSAELAAHADMEERFFYVPLLSHDLTQEKARHSVAEHQELDDHVELLQEYDLSASKWLVSARRLARRLRHHLDEEEHEVFQIAGKVLTDDQKTSLANDYRDGVAARRSDTTC